VTSIIRVRALRKEFQVHVRPPGVAAALRSLLRRQYKAVVAVGGIDLDIQPGERVGFLGPNGAGKTTTLKILSGLLHPTSGEVRVDGHEPRRREDALLKKIMLVLGQKQQLLWDLPPSGFASKKAADPKIPPRIQKWLGPRLRPDATDWLAAARLCRAQGASGRAARARRREHGPHARGLQLHPAAPDAALLARDGALAHVVVAVQRAHGPRLLDRGQPAPRVQLAHLHGRVDDVDLGDDGAQSAQAEPARGAQPLEAVEELHRAVSRERAHRREQSV
jgi:ABC-type oligopeptide transport system ATPase subunit